MQMCMCLLMFCYIGVAENGDSSLVCVIVIYEMDISFSVVVAFPTIMMLIDRYERISINLWSLKCFSLSVMRSYHKH